MNTVQNWLIAALVAMGLITSSAMAGAKPDFTNADAVFGGIKSMLDACTKAGASDCVVRCGYAQKTLTNFLKANPDGDPSIMQQRWQPCFDAHSMADLQAPAPAAAGGAGAPDFSDHEAVLASIRMLRGQCNEDAACIKQCDYTLKAMKNFVHPQPHYVGLRKGKWESCRNKVPGTAVAKAAVPKPDRSKFVVAGLPLGGDMNPHKGRMYLLKAHGYFNKTKNEYSELLVGKSGATNSGPDVVRNYEGSIKEPSVHIFFEAAADGSIYKIQFHQKEKMDPDEVAAAVIARYGKPTKRHGRYLSWGCDKGPEAGFCVKTNVSENGLEIWAFDEDVKKAGYKDYDDRLMEAKGIKKGLKF